MYLVLTTSHYVIILSLQYYLQELELQNKSEHTARVEETHQFKKTATVFEKQNNELKTQDKKYKKEIDQLREELKVHI